VTFEGAMATPTRDVPAANMATVPGQGTGVGWKISFNRIGPAGRWRSTAPS
jgi:hypothetical protein